MSRALDKMASLHALERMALHALKLPGLLIYAPVAFAGDESRRHLDRPAGEGKQVRDLLRGGRASIPLQAALEARPGKLRTVDREVALREPAALLDLRRRRHMRSHRLGHALGGIHDVVLRQFRELACVPGRERMRAVPGPVRALVMIVGAQERMQALPAIAYVVFRFARRVVPLVMLARARQ